MTESYSPVVDGTCAADCGRDIAAGEPARRVVSTGETYHEACVPDEQV